MATEEFTRQATLCGSIADAMFASIIEILVPMNEASVRAILAVVAATANMQLLCRHVVLDHLRLSWCGLSHQGGPI